MLELLLEEKHDSIMSNLLAKKIDTILKLANDVEFSMKSARTIVRPKTNPDLDTPFLLDKLKISITYMYALEYSSDII